MIELTQLTLAITATIVPWMIAQKWGVIPFTSPLHLVAVFTFLGVLVKTIFYIFNPELSFYSRFLPGTVSTLSGYLYIWLFVLMICTGYLFATKYLLRVETTLSKSSLDVFRGNSWVFLFGLVGFLAVSNVFLAARGVEQVGDATAFDIIHSLNMQKLDRIEGEERFGISHAGIKAFYVISLAAFIILLARALVKPTTGNIIYAFALGLCMVIAAIIQGKRFELLNLIFYYVIVSSIVGKTIKSKDLITLSLGMSLVILVYTAMTVMRATKSDWSQAEFLFPAALQQIVGSTYFLDINVPILLTNMMDRADFLLGSSYLTTFYGWIPRSIWIDKPPISLGPYFKQEILGIYTIGGINPTASGEAYMNFGWAGIFVGFVLGFTYRKLEVYFLSPVGLQRRFGLVTYPLIAFPLIAGTLQSTFGAMIVTSMVEFLILAIVLRIPFSNLHGLRASMAPQAPLRL